MMGHKQRKIAFFGHFLTGIYAIPGQNRPSAHHFGCTVDKGIGNKTPTSEVNEIISEVNETTSEVDETTLETNGVPSPTLVARFLTRASLSLILAFCLHCLHLVSKPLIERDLR